MKGITKVGLSLLIAFAFIVPSGAIMANNNTVEAPEAVTNTAIDQYTVHRVPNQDFISQDPEDITIDSVLFVPKDSAGNVVGDPFTIGMGDKIPQADCYGIILELTNPTGVTEDCILPQVDIYTTEDGAEYIMYETSFEDNYDIWNNWMQTDADCGLAGPNDVLDTFTWTDARASDGDHSMKNTMYDVYKGDQVDYLTCTQPFDVSDQYKWRIDFDCWVEGEGLFTDGANYEHIVFDYLSFEIGDGSGDWYNPDWYGYNGLAMDGEGYVDDCGEWVWTQKEDMMFFRFSENGGIEEGSYFFADTTWPLQAVGEYAPYADYTPKVEEIGNGWWHVWYEVPVQDLIDFGFDVENMMFRFDWHSDVQFQYEGAYVDNIIVTSIESEEVKLFQASAQECVEVPAESSIYFEVTHHATNDLNWCGFEKGSYRIKAYHCGNLSKTIIDFDIVDLVDCGIQNLVVEDSFTATTIPDGGRMTAGQDAHIMYDFCNYGNLPVEDVAITAKAYKLVWDDVYSTDFEGLGWSSTGSFDGPTYWHQTTDDAWSGSKSLAFYNKDTKHYENDVYYGYAESPATIDFEDAEEVLLDYYYKAILCDDQDYSHFMFSIPTGAYNFFGGLVGGTGIFGPIYQPTWVGPNQPQGKYETYSLMGSFDYFHNLLGLGFNPDGTENLEWGIGLAFQSGPSGYANHQAEMHDEYWSGVMYDDISIRAKTKGDVVWSDTVILPGPVEPGDCIEGIQFEWEDVPYSHYIIEVCSACTDDICPDNNCKNQIIYVMDDLERATDKLVESIDLTCVEEGEWGISSSDTNNHFCSNPTENVYTTGYLDNVFRLAPTEGTKADGSSVDVSDEYPEIIDISHMTTIPLDFDVWYDLEWNVDYVYLQVADVDNSEGFDPETGLEIADQETDWVTVMAFTDWSWYFDIDDDGWYHVTIPDLGTYFDTSTGFMALRFKLDLNAGSSYKGFRGFRFDNFEMPGLFNIETITEPGLTADLIDTGDDMDNWVNEPWCMGTNWVPDGDFCFTAVNDTGGDGWEEGIPFDDALVWTTEIQDAYEAVYSDTVTIESPLGQWLPIENNIGGETVWESGYYDLRGDHKVALEMLFWTFIPEEVRLVSLDPSTTAETDQHSWTYGEINTGYPVFDIGYLYFEFDPDTMIHPANVKVEVYYPYGGIPAGAIDMHFGLTSSLFLEFSPDGGESWMLFDEYIFDDAIQKPLWPFLDDNPYRIHPDNYDLTPWAGQDILFRYRYVGDMGGDAQICNMEIIGKKDTTAPSSTITMSGTMADSGWYSTPVQCTITATDDNAVKEIHYILDGSEKIVAGDKASFTVSGNGAHNIEFWAIDVIGNVETPHNTVPTFRIDSGSPPTVAITAPEPGLYLFGNKLLSLSKVFIIGAFTVEATASDAESGVYRVQFLLDGDVIADDTEAPFSAYVATKHMGAGTLKVVAEDFSGNTAEDTLDITYYKFL